MAIDKIWVLAEERESGPTPITLELLTEARSVAGTATLRVAVIAPGTGFQVISKG